MNGPGNARLIAMVNDKAGTGMVAPDADIASQALKVPRQVEALALGAAEFKRAKDKKDALA